MAKVKAKQLNTVAEVIAFLGGETAVARLTGRAVNQVHNWRYRERFAARVFLLMLAALARRGATASPALWGIEGDDLAA